MEPFDVIIVGAGLSGIGAAKHLQDKCPGKRFTILEGREAIGGTWDIFRYPGIRSDSDMHTLGYNFKPWKEAKAIADGPSILRYVNETADENHIREHIRFRHLVRSASWSSADALWTVDVELADTGETRQLRGRFLFMCGGYYSYQQGHTPEFEGIDHYRGRIVHPQFWPEDLDYSGKQVVVIGSGATAMTLVPSMSDKAAKVTMLQRSPTYVVSAPDRDRIANALRRFLPEKLAYAITRWKNVQLQRLFYNRSRTRPEKVKKTLLNMVRKHLPDFDVDTHFTPSYNPWDERLCLIPNADLFESIKAGKVEVVTDHISHFSDSGIVLQSGKVLDADIVVMATGLKLVVLSDVKFTIDDETVNFSDTWTYKGMMFSGVPNMVQTFGYINASWTLRADLTSEYVCRLLNHMDEIGVTTATPQLREQDRDMKARPWIDDFSPGYMKRVMHLFPKQGEELPWCNTQNYALDKKMIRHGPIEDDALVFGNPSAGSNEAPEERQVNAA